MILIEFRVQPPADNRFVIEMIRSKFPQLSITTIRAAIRNGTPVVTVDPSERDLINEGQNDAEKLIQILAEFDRRSISYRLTEIVASIDENSPHKIDLTRTELARRVAMNDLMLDEATEQGFREAE